MKLILSSISTLARSVLCGISWLTQFALPATIALGFFVSWIAFGPFALLFLVPFLVRQKPDPAHGERTAHIMMGLLALGLSAAYGISWLYAGDQIQELSQAIAKLRSVRSGIADGAAAGTSTYHGHIFLGEALGGVLMTALAFYSLVKPGRYHDMLSLAENLYPGFKGWGPSVFLFVLMSGFTCFFAKALLTPQPTLHDSAAVYAGLMPTISFIWLQQATGVIRILPRLLPDVEART
jgi:hypothetical protein